MLGKKIFESYAHYDWTDHPRKWWWTFRIVLAFLIIAACILMITRRPGVNTDNVIYAILILLTLIRLPKKFKRRKMFKEAILLLKNQSTDNGNAYNSYSEETYEQAQNNEEYRYQQEEAQRQYQQAADTGFKFFTGCVTKEDLDATYKKLASIYHPDQNAGDEETFKKIQAEYAEEVLKYA